MSNSYFVLQQVLAGEASPFASRGRTHSEKERRSEDVPMWVDVTLAHQPRIVPVKQKEQEYQTHSSTNGVYSTA